MKKALPVLLALLLALSLCACSAGELLGGIFGGILGGKGKKQDSAADSAAGALADYAGRLRERGADKAADAVLQKLGSAAAADARKKAADAADDPRIAMVRKLARTGVRKELQKQARGGMFADVSGSDWYYDAVAWALEKEIVSGETFSPADPCTRAQAMTFLWRAKGKPTPNLRHCPFTDVAESAYYYEPVLWAFESGLLSAATDGQFHPDDPVTRAQTATFLYRAEGAPRVDSASPYADVQDSDWFAPAAIWAWSEDVVTLNDARTFDPQGKCTRAHYVNFLYRCYGK